MTSKSNSIKRIAPRGFSLVELAVVISIIGILAMLAFNGIVFTSNKARANNATFELSAMFSVGQIRAQAVGRPQYVVFWQNGANYGAQVLDYIGTAAIPAWTAMTPGAPDKTLFTTVDQLRLSSSDKVALPDLPTAKTKIAAISLLSAFPSPYQAVRMTGSGGASLLAKACSFCVDQGGGALGVLRFNTTGTMDVLTGPSTAGGSVALSTSLSTTTTVADARILAITSPLGTVRVYR